MTFNIIGIDPSTTHIGVSILTIDEYSLKIVNIVTEHIFIKEYAIPNEHNNALIYKMRVLQDRIEEILRKYRPMAVAIEQPFINMRFRPTAVIPLARALQVLENNLYMYNPYMLIARPSPGEVKNALGAKGGTGKEPVLEAILSSKEITKYISPNDITDHEIDATGVAYYLYNTILQNPLLILDSL